MVVKYPTGLYKIKMRWLNDSNTEDMVDNVTWFVSSTEPPRTFDVFPFVTKTSGHETLPEKWHSMETRRMDAGQLVFSIKESNNRTVSSIIQQFEFGQSIEYDQLALMSSTEVAPGSKTEIRHDTNELDVNGVLLPLGIDPNKIIKEAEKIMEQHTKDLNNIRSEIMILETKIGETQKQINECVKIKDVVAMVDQQSAAAIEEEINKLKAKMEEDVARHDSLVAEAENIKSKIDAIAKLVR